MDGLPQQKQYNITHIQQRYNWDCGLSCIMMILTAAQRQQLLENFESICAEEGFGYSTWTIDLCYLLRRFQVRHEYHTKTLGIDPTYGQYGYYEKIIVKDEKRVLAKFKAAAAHGLHVSKSTMDMKILIQHLGQKGPIILLANASLLTCDICKPNILEKFGCFKLSCIVENTRTNKSYAGHYVVLCGYNQKLNKVYYRNPEVHDGHLCQCSTGALDTARKAYGTDEDVILIFQN